MNERSNKGYWNKRALEYSGDLKNMVLVDKRFPRHNEMCQKVLALFKDCTVLDVCCGYGRFADSFDPAKYLGIDFSEVMIEKAKELNPLHTFQVADAHTFTCDKVDVVFETISLAMLNMSELEFITKYESMARKAIVCLGVTDYYIHLV